MWSWMALILVLLQMGAAGWAFATGHGELFNLAFTELSPVLLFFSLLNEIGVSISIRVTNFLIFSLAWNAWKYVFYLIALKHEGKNQIILAALFIEVIYVGLATYSFFHYQEL